MTDDLKEQLGVYGKLGTRGSDHPHSVVCREALARITDLEARLAAAEAEVQRIKEINVAHCRAVNTLLVCESRMETRAKAAEAGEDALAEALRPFGFFSDEPNTTQQAWEIRYCDRFEDWIDFGDMESARDALAAYDARRKG